VARQLLDVIPVAGWAVQGAVAYAGTRALGEAALMRLETGMPGGDSVRPSTQPLAGASRGAPGSHANAGCGALRPRARLRGSARPSDRVSPRGTRTKRQP